MPGVRAGPDGRCDAAVDLRADPVACGAHRRVGAATEQRRRACRADLGFIGDHQGQVAQRLVHPGGHGVVDVGEVGDLPDQVEVDLGDQVVLRREVGVGGGRGHFGAGRHGAHRQVGVRLLSQCFHAGGEHLAEGLLLAAVARRLSGLAFGLGVIATSASLDTCPSYRMSATRSKPG